MTASGNLTLTDRERILSALGKALTVAAPSRSIERRLFFQIVAVRDAPETASAELVELLNAISEIPGLQAFEHGHQWNGWYWHKIDHFFLMNWLISRGQETSAIQAVQELDRSLCCTRFDSHFVLAVDGLTVEAPIKLGAFDIIPWSGLPSGINKWEITARSLFGGSQPTMAVVKRLSVDNR